VRWLQARSILQPGQKARVALSSLTAGQQAKLQAELQGILLAVGGGLQILRL